MFDHAHDGFTQTMANLPWLLGCTAALVILVLVVAALIILIDTLLGTLDNATRTHRLRRTWRRSGRTPTR